MLSMLPISNIIMSQLHKTRLIALLLLCLISLNNSQITGNETEPQSPKSKSNENNNTGQGRMETIGLFEIQVPMSPLMLGSPFQMGGDSTDDFEQRQQSLAQEEGASFQNPEILELSEGLQGMVVFMIDRDWLPDDIKAIDKELQSRYKQVVHLPVRYFQSSELAPSKAYRIVYGGINASENFVVYFDEHSEMQIFERYNLIYKIGQPLDLHTEPIGTTSYENASTEPSVFRTGVQDDEQIRKIMDVETYLHNEFELLSQQSAMYYVIRSSENSTTFKIVFRDKFKSQNFIVDYESNGQTQVQMQYFIVDYLIEPVEQVPPFASGTVQSGGHPTGEAQPPFGWTPTVPHQRGEQPILGFLNDDGSFVPLSHQPPLQQGSHTINDSKGAVNELEEGASFQNPEILELSEGLQGMVVFMIDRDWLPDDIKAIDKELQSRYKQVVHLPVRYFQSSELAPSKAYRIVYGGINASENFVVYFDEHSEMQIFERYNLIYKIGQPLDLHTEPIGTTSYENASTEPSVFRTGVQDDEQIRKIMDVETYLHNEFELLSQQSAMYYVIRSSENSTTFKIVFRDKFKSQNFIVDYESNGQTQVQMQYFIVDYLIEPVEQVPPFASGTVQSGGHPTGEAQPPFGWTPTVPHQRGEQPILGFLNDDGSFVPLSHQPPLQQGSHTINDSKGAVNELEEGASFQNPEILELSEGLQGMVVFMIDRDWLPDDIKAIDKELQSRYKQVVHLPVRYFQSSELAPSKAYRIVYGGINASENFVVYFDEHSEMQIFERYNLIYKIGQPLDLHTEPIGTTSYENASTEPSVFRTGVQDDEQIRKIMDVETYLHNEFELLSQQSAMYYVIRSSENSTTFKIVFRDKFKSQNFIVDYESNGQTQVQMQYFIVDYLIEPVEQVPPFASGTVQSGGHPTGEAQPPFGWTPTVPHQRGEQPILGFLNDDGSFVPLSHQPPLQQGSHTINDSKGAVNELEEGASFQNPEILELSEGLQGMVVFMIDRDWLPDDIKAIDKELQSRYKQVVHLPVRYFQSSELAPSKAYRIVYGGINASENFVVYFDEHSEMQIFERYNLIYKIGQPLDLHTEPIGTTSYENASTEPSVFRTGVQDDEQIRKIMDVETYLHNEFELLSQQSAMYYVIRSSENSTTFKIVFRDKFKSQNFIVDYESNGQTQVQMQYFIVDYLIEPVEQVPPFASGTVQSGGHPKKGPAQTCNETTGLPSPPTQVIDPPPIQVIDPPPIQVIDPPPPMVIDPPPIQVIDPPPPQVIDPPPIQVIDPPPPMVIDPPPIQVIDPPPPQVIDPPPPQVFDPPPPQVFDPPPVTEVVEPPQRDNQINRSNKSTDGQPAPANPVQTFEPHSKGSHQVNGSKNQSIVIQPLAQDFQFVRFYRPSINIQNEDKQLPEDIKAVNKELRTIYDLHNYVLTRFKRIDKVKGTYEIQYFGGNFIDLTVIFDANQRRIEVLERKAEQRVEILKEDQIPNNVKIIDKKLRSEYDLQNYILAVQEVEDQSHGEITYKLVYISGHIQTFYVYFSADDKLILILAQNVQQIDRMQSLLGKETTNLIVPNSYN